MVGYSRSRYCQEVLRENMLCFLSVLDSMDNMLVELVLHVVKGFLV